MANPPSIVNWYWTATDGRVYSGARNVLGEYI